MIRRSGWLMGFLVVSALSAGCTTAPTVDLAAEEQAVRDRDAAFAQAATNKDLEAALAFYAPDAALMMSNAPAATTADARRKAFTDMMAMPGFSMSWSTTMVQVAQAGDMAVTSGPYRMTMTGPTGPMEDRGKYLTVWRKVNGVWLAVFDVANTDLPAAPPPAP